MADAVERVVRNEAIFRDANERIEERLNDLTLDNGRSPFLCECEDTACTTVVRLSLGEYEHIREDSRWFVIARGHSHTVGRVIERTDRFEILQKDGEAAPTARETDPRRHE